MFKVLCLRRWKMYCVSWCTAPLTEKMTGGSILYKDGIREDFKEGAPNLRAYPCAWRVEINLVSKRNLIRIQPSWQKEISRYFKPRGYGENSLRLHLPSLREHPVFSAQVSSFTPRKKTRNLSRKNRMLSQTRRLSFAELRWTSRVRSVVRPSLWRKHHEASQLLASSRKLKDRA